MNFETAVRDVSRGGDAPYRPRSLYNPERMTPDQLLSLADLGFVRRGRGWPGDPGQGPSEVRRAFRAWVARYVDEKRANAAFFDTTTLVTADKLINDPDASRYLTPATLLDLSTFVNGVVLFDRVFHLENPHVRSHRFNDALGNEEVFIELPLYGSEDGEDQVGTHEGVRQTFMGAGYEVAFWNQEMRTAEDSELGAEDRRAIEEGWRAILGRPLTTEDVFPRHSLTHPDMGISSLDWTGSNGPLLLRVLVGETMSSRRASAPATRRGRPRVSSWSATIGARSTSWSRTPSDCPTCRAWHGCPSTGSSTGELGPSSATSPR